MNDFQKAKVERFINDKEMSGAVFQIILNSFLEKEPNSDVYILAASMLSVGKLKRAWKELEKFEQAKETAQVGVKQIGL